jgi:hypothetical protein
MKRAGYVARMVESRNAYKVLMGKPEGKRGIGKPRCKWEDNIKIDFKNQTGWRPLHLHG